MNRIMIQYNNKNAQVGIDLVLLNNEDKFIEAYGKDIFKDIRKICLKRGGLDGFINHATETTADNYVSCIVIDGNNKDIYISKQIRQISPTNLSVDNN